MGGKEYVLSLMDDKSGYTWPWPTEDERAEVNFDALSTWVEGFGSMKWIVSDQGSHFKNQLMERLGERISIEIPFYHGILSASKWICRESM